MLIFITACNKIPEDLQKRKDNLSEQNESLGKRYDTETNTSNYQDLINDYSSFKQEILDYTNECNKRGIEKENNELIAQVEDRINKLKEKLLKMSVCTQIEQERMLRSSIESLGNSIYQINLLSSADCKFGWYVVYQDKYGAILTCQIVTEGNSNTGNITVLSSDCN